MSTNYAKEFKQFEDLFAKYRSSKSQKATILKESRSSADIQVEIDRLQQELAQAKINEKSATYTKFPTELYAWSMYIDESEKGNWWS